MAILTFYYQQYALQICVHGKFVGLWLLSKLNTVITQLKHVHAKVFSTQVAVKQKLDKHRRQLYSITSFSNVCIAS
jgi:hypothetical protein